jgi:hypothetical protein
MTAANAHDLQAGARELAEEWSRFVAAVALTLSPETSEKARRALADTNLTLYRSLALFLCGSERGRRDRRDITPRDFLGSDWWPSDEELDQRLRGRLDKISKLKSHLTWHRVDDTAMVLWPWALLAWEISFALNDFIRALNAVASPFAELLERTRDELLPDMPPKDFPAATNEHAAARAGQVQH